MMTKTQELILAYEDIRIAQAELFQAKERIKSLQAMLRYPEPLAVVEGLFFYGCISAVVFANPYEVKRKSDGKCFRKSVGFVDVILGSPSTVVKFSMVKWLQPTGEFKLHVELPYRAKRDKNGNQVLSKDSKVIEDHDIRFGDNFHDLISPKLAEVVNQFLSKHPELVKTI